MNWIERGSTPKPVTGITRCPARMWRGESDPRRGPLGRRKRPCSTQRSGRSQALSFRTSSRRTGRSRLPSTTRVEPGVRPRVWPSSRVWTRGSTLWPWSACTPGDAKILRNPGARVTEDVLGALVLATSLLGVNRILVMPHTDCRMASADEAAVHEAIFDASGIDSRSLEFRTVSDQHQALVSDVTRIRTFPFLPQAVVVAGAIYDVHEGTLTTVDA